ncbi:MAG: long-chain fatty acid--CoA ligase [Acidobacteriota bacterium]
MTTIPELLRSRAAETPDRTFLVFEGLETTYRELDERSDRVASALIAQGIGAGDAVAVCMGNRPEFLLAWWGILKAGAALVPVNPALRPPEVDYIRRDSGARLMLTDAPEAPPLPQLPELRPDGLAAIVYTSGTTGKPKGAMLSHANYLWDAEAIAKATRMTEADRFLCILPLFHVNAQVVTTLAPMVAGGSMVLMGKFSPIEMLETLARTGCSAFSGVPTVYTVLNNTPGAQEYDLSRLRFCICGAAPMPVEVFREFERKYAATIVEGYGLTEGTCASSVNPLARRKIGSIGVALDGQEMKLVDGEILIRGPNVMSGYFKNPTATAEAIRDGWLCTGDLARVDEDGYFYLVGRKKEMIIRGGQKIYPKEVEEVLYQHPAVAEAAVAGIADAKWGEEVVAYVVRRGEVTEAELIDFCGQRLAGFKCPKAVCFREALPKTATGKIQKHLLE